MPEDNEMETVITLNAEAADDTSTEVVDRGDNFTGEEPTGAPAEETVDLDALKAVADEQPIEDAHDKAESRIPKARFDEVNARMKAAEAELQQLRAQAGQQPAQKAAPAAQEPAQVDLDAAEDAYLQAVTQGDTARARQIRSAINHHIQQQAEAAAVARVSDVIDKRDAHASLVAIANESIIKYPFLNADSEEANKAAIDDVVEWRDYYASKGFKPAEALQKAVDKIVPLYAPKAAPKDDPAPELKTDGRTKEAIQRNALAANAQPAQLNGIGERATSRARVDVSKMSEEEFDALPASEKKRLRGDA